MDGREQMKENKVPPEEGGVSRRAKMENEGSERNRSVSDGLPVITMLCLLELLSFFFNLKTNWVCCPYIHINHHSQCF